MERFLAHPDAIRGLSVSVLFLAMALSIAVRGIEAEEQYPPFLRRYKIVKHVCRTTSVGFAILAAAGLVYSQLG
jgi:hypothetical protein